MYCITISGLWSSASLSTHHTERPRTNAVADQPRLFLEPHKSFLRSDASMSCQWSQNVVHNSYTNPNEYYKP